MLRRAPGRRERILDTVWGSSLVARTCWAAVARSVAAGAGDSAGGVAGGVWSITSVMVASFLRSRRPRLVRAPPRGFPARVLPRPHPGPRGSRSARPAAGLQTLYARL